MRATGLIDDRRASPSVATQNPTASLGSVSALQFRPAIDTAARTPSSRDDVRRLRVVSQAPHRLAEPGAIATILLRHQLAKRVADAPAPARPSLRIHPITMPFAMPLTRKVPEA